MTDKQIPEGFEPLFRSSPYLDLLGPIYSRIDEAGLVLGVRAHKKHCNARGKVHGGVFSSIADVALGYSAAFAGDTAVPLVTLSLTLDYAGGADEGDWIEIHSDVQKRGSRMAFVNGYFLVNERRIVRASAVFSVAA